MKPIRFKYKNWKGIEHEYVMTPEPGLTYGSYGDEEAMTWLISGWVVSRDGVLRPGRRTFKLVEMRDMELVT